jgi:hypothetical protein
MSEMSACRASWRPAHLWTCSGCKNPIQLGQGYIVVLDPEIAPPSDQSHVTRLRREIRRASSLFGDQSRNQRISFRAYHSRCDPHPATEPYWIAVEEAESLEAWCAWVGHLCDKTWMGVADVRQMIGFWFTNRGQPLVGLEA